MHGFYQNLSYIYIDKGVINYIYGVNNTRLAMSMHAETRVIFEHKRKGRNVNGKIVFVIKLSKTGNIAYSKPCENCIRFMKKHGIKGVIYSDGNNDFIYEKMNEIIGSKSAGFKNRVKTIQERCCIL